MDTETLFCALFRILLGSLDAAALTFPADRSIMLPRLSLALTPETTCLQAV